ncbi:MAG: DUF1499 domain-containing protein [Parvibaculum sp.]|uniref:DUF1499 domain-containing protein n=1 Tax=Parvibaculum sp. TaxID=2024848 RepID=UPI0032F08A76
MSERKSRLAAVGLWLGVVGLAVLVLGIVGQRFGVVDFRIALLALAAGAAIGALAAVVSAVGLLLTLFTARRGARTAIAGLVLGVLAAAPIAQAMIAGSQVPRIHDISTDLDNPPSFEAAVTARGENANPLDRATPADLAELQRQAYPDIATLVTGKDTDAVFAAALETAREMEWDILASDPETGLIEATATTAVMNFKDDVAIRVTETDAGAAVDVRSVSRVGESDLGANANRIRTYLHALRVKLGDAG